MDPLYILIMFVLSANGSQTAVRVGYQDQIACVAAGRALQQGFQASPETRDMKVVWSCSQDRTAGSPPALAIEPVPQPPPPAPERRQQRPRARSTPPAEPHPVPLYPKETEEQRYRRSMPEWLGGDKK